MNLKLIYMTYRDVKDLIEKGYTNLIIPIGTLEAHGPHLPIGTDILIPEIIAESIAEKIKALIAPAIPYGVTTSLLRYHGGTSVSEKTLEQMIVEIIRNFNPYGFDVFIIINGHGGNINPIRNAVRYLWKESRIKSIVIHWWIYAGSITEKIFGEPGGHAGVDETSMILATHPQLVKKIDIDSEVTIVKRGLEVYPSAGSLILYEEDKGRPIFDIDLSKKYFNAVIRELLSEINDLIKKLKAI